MPDTNQISNTSKAIKGMSSQTIVTILTGVVEIVSFSIMSRLLTKEDFGYYAAISAVLAVFKSLSETGIGSAIIQRKNPDSKFINNAFTINLFFGVFLVLLMVLLSRPLSRLVVDESMTVPMIILSLTLLIHCLKSVNSSIMIRRLEFMKLGAINLVSDIVTVVVAIVLAVKGFGYYAIITKVVLSSVLSLIISYFFVNTKFSIEFDKNTFKSIFSFSGWLMLSSVIRNLSQQIDKLLMSRLLSVKDLGAYNRPKDFVFYISSNVGNIFDTALFPILSNIQDNKQSLLNGYKRSLFLLNMLGMLLSTSFIINSELIIRVFFGEQWMSLNVLFMILSLYIVFNMNGRLLDCYIRSLGLTKQQFFFRCVQLVLTITGLFLTFRWGTVGVGTSVIVVNFLMVMFKMIYISKKIDFLFFDALLDIIRSCRFLIIGLPVGIAAKVFFPNTWGGNILTAVLWLMVLIFVFLLCPQIAGEEYKKGVYVKIVNVIKKMVSKLYKSNKA